MEFDPYSETFFEDPWETYRWLRDQHPVYHHERLGFYAVSRYDDCLEVHKDAVSFSSTPDITHSASQQSAATTVVPAATSGPHF